MNPIIFFFLYGWCFSWSPTKVSKGNNEQHHQDDEILSEDIIAAKF